MVLAGGKTGDDGDIAGIVAPALLLTCVSGVVGGPHRGAGTKGRPANAGNRFFEGVLAAHRGTADAAGIDWQSAIYRKVQEEVKANRGLTIERMVELGRVSRSGFYRFDADKQARPDPDMDLRDSIQRIALEWPSYAQFGLYQLRLNVQ